uniref:Aminopeptidase n=1 Tax=Pristhesancus plagipennis TaxID=1955184 RepID=A0A2K8JME3_PRIPG|nr:secreted Aminopeptidase-like protein [Pristhesancus plagipennis]
MLKLLILTYCLSYVHCLPGYRLPGDVVPQLYRLKVIADIEEPNFNFSGTVSITIKCLKATNTIILHAKELEIDPKEVKINEVAGEDELLPVQILQQRFVPENEFYLIKLDQNLKPGKTYKVLLGFSGDLTEGLVGFYRSSYKDKSSNSTKWLAVTQFESTYARKAFPCFDEPAMKAKFSIEIGHKEKFNSISNMPLKKTKPMKDRKGWIWNDFEVSVPMSTYLVAYLIGDFVYKEAPPKDNNVTFRIWSRREAIDQVEFAKKVGPEVLEYYEELFDVKYPLPKQDMAAIPDFSAGAMENWGLITYREIDLLYDEKASAILNKQRIASVIAHELAHQWFGNLVTMEWWTDLWLNEGFATYVGRLGVHKVFPEWNHFEEDIVDNIELVYELDSLKTSHKISIEVKHPDDISQIFDTISYRKGSAIIHMMHQFLGKSFETGVSDYLKEHKYGNAEQDDLWKALTDRAHKDGILDPELTVKEIMDSWTLQTGYPIITADRDYKTGTVQLSQKRYLKIPAEAKDANETNACWWIPLTYTTQSAANFRNTVPKQWLKCGQNVHLEGLLKPDEWLILNINLGGVYRVLYDARNWQMIIKTLNSDNYKTISALNRASLLMDIFDFAWRGDMSYDVAFEALSYLKSETEHIPLSTGLTKLSALGQMLKRTSAYGSYSKFVKTLITPIYQKYSNLLNVPDKLEELRMHMLINRWACTHRMGTCVQQIEKVFNEWRSLPNPDSENPIPTNVRSIVYCNAIKYGDADTWEFLWERYLNSNHGSEKNTILTSLACSRDIWILNRYLEWSLDDRSQIRKQDSTSVFSFVAGQAIGYYVACDFLKSRLLDIHQYHSDRPVALGRYLGACSRNVIFNHEAEKWKSFVNNNKETLKGAQLAADQAIETATANTKWYNNHYNNVMKILSAGE